MIAVVDELWTTGSQPVDKVDRHDGLTGNTLPGNPPDAGDFAPLISEFADRLAVVADTQPLEQTERGVGPAAGLTLGVPIAVG